MTLRGLVLGLAAVCLVLPGAPALAAVSMADLQSGAQQMKAREAKIWSAREAEQRAELQKQQAQAATAEARRANAEARSKALDSEWNTNDARINEMKGLLHQHQGNLGELFGVTRQVAGDSVTVLSQSLLNTQFPVAKGEESRVEFMRRIAGAKELPAFAELERMWFELHREMTENGKVVKFTAPVIQPDKSVVEQEVVRVGPFMVSSGDQFLLYDSADQTLSVMPRQLASSDRALAEDLQAATGSEGFREAVVDPSRGPLMGMVSDRPSMFERIAYGEAVGYLIVLVGVLGFVLAVFQYGYLFLTRAKVNAQLKDLSNLNKQNPLGRLLIEHKSGGKPGESPEVVELRLSEAVLREVPKLQRFQAFLRLAVAAGPLLGLVGTVVGMIITFHAITATGSSDPKMMAHGIGQAMIATVLGLGIAIPLLFMVAGLVSLSNGITQILDEQAQACLAKDIESSRAA